MKKIVLILATFYLLSCTTTQNTKSPEDIESGEPVKVEETTPITSDQLPFPSLMNVNKQQFIAQSMVNGEVIETSTDPLGMLQVVILTEYTYYFQGEVITLQYYLVFGGMEELYKNRGDKISMGDELGLASIDSYLTSYADNLDSFMLRMTEDRVVKHNNNWYFTPNWLVSRGTAWLTFKPVNSFKTALDGYFNRVMLDGINSSGTQVVYNEPWDRIRFKITLDEYPSLSSRNEAIESVEQNFYRGQKIFVLENLYKEYSVNDYRVIIYWQSGFETYLQNEYTLGDDLYVYGSIYALDHDKKEILVCTRDFSLLSDEEIVTNKRNEIE